MYECFLWEPDGALPNVLSLDPSLYSGHPLGSMCLGVMATFRIPGDNPMDHVAVLSLSAGLLGSLQCCPFLIISSPAGGARSGLGQGGRLMHTTPCSLLGQTTQTIFSNSYQNGNLLPSVSPAEGNSFSLQG